MKKLKATNYQLMNVANKRTFKDSGWMLCDPDYNQESFIRTIFKKKQIDIKDDSYGLYKYTDWLPIHRTLKGSCAPQTYKSKGLAEYLGLSNLYITFSGYWPKIGARMETCSFKETEAYSVCGRLAAKGKDFMTKTGQQKILVVASAGNSARAFAKVCSENNIPLLLFVPEDYTNSLWFKKPIKDCVKLISTPSGTDYFDAINLSNIVCGESDLFLNEGGAKNVARRDGMGTTVISATAKIGHLPDVYFQGIGSGTGTIAAWEAAIRLIDDGRFGNKMMKLIPSQNIPFTPMYDAWNKDSRTLEKMDTDNARKRSCLIDSLVLGNRKPPYGITGGVYDALKDTKGDIEIATNDDIKIYSKIFLDTEGIDIHPAAAVAVKSVVSALKHGTIHKDDCIMINITGGGEKLFKKEHEIHFLKPNLIISTEEKVDIIMENIRNIFDIHKNCS
ncbi:MAG: cysteate synthase [Bacteroidales bacterium]